MKYTFFILTVGLLLFNACLAQEDSTSIQKFKHIEYGGMALYPKNYQGLEQFMSVLAAQQDTFTYHEMSKTFARLKERRQSGKILGYTGVGIGAALMVGTAISTSDNDRFESNNAAGYIAGTIVIGAGIALYQIFNVGEKDIRKFIDQHNNLHPSPTKKLKLVVQSRSIGPNQFIGLKLAWNLSK